MLISSINTMDREDSEKTMKTERLSQGLWSTNEDRKAIPSTLIKQWRQKCYTKLTIGLHTIRHLFLWSSWLQGEKITTLLGDFESFFSLFSFGLRSFPNSPLAFLLDIVKTLIISAIIKYIYIIMFPSCKLSISCQAFYCCATMLHMSVCLSIYPSSCPAGIIVLS